MPSAYDSHELPAERIKTIRVAKRHLCELAMYRGKLDETQCQNCKLACKYGMRLLDLMGLPYIAQPEKELTVKALSKQGQALPTLHQRLKHRKGK